MRAAVAYLQFYVTSKNLPLRGSAGPMAQPSQTSQVFQPSQVSQPSQRMSQSHISPRQRMSEDQGPSNQRMSQVFQPSQVVQPSQSVQIQPANQPDANQARVMRPEPGRSLFQAGQHSASTHANLMSSRQWITQSYFNQAPPANVGRFSSPVFQAPGYAPQTQTAAQNMWNLSSLDPSPHVTSVRPVSPVTPPPTTTQSGGSSSPPPHYNQAVSFPTTNQVGSNGHLYPTLPSTMSRPL